MIIGYPRKTNKVEIHQRLKLKGSDIKLVGDKYQITSDHFG